MIQNARYLHSIYCDDVRREINGKITLVGTYPGGLTFNQPAPAILPKLCIVLTAQTPIENLFERLEFRVLLDDVVVQKIEIPQKELNAQAASVKASPPDNASFQTIGAVLELANIPIHGPCKIGVRAVTEREELGAAALRINFHPTANPSDDKPPPLANAHAPA